MKANAWEGRPAPGLLVPRRDEKQSRSARSLAWMGPTRSRVAETWATFSDFVAVSITSVVSDSAGIQPM